MKDLKWAERESWGWEVELRVSWRWWPLFIQRAALLKIPFLLPSRTAQAESKKTFRGPRVKRPSRF